jgi:DKNYY family protein
MRRKLLFVVAMLTGIALILVGAYAQSRNSNKQPVASDSSGLYFKDRYGVYILIPRDCSFIGCIGPDLRLVKYRTIPHADPETFQILISPKSDTSTTGEILARDRNYVFYGGRYVATGDVSTLQVLGEHAKDKNNLYFRGLVIQGLDTSTVHFPGGDFIADRNGLYLGNASPPRKVALVDSPTFKILPRLKTLNSKDYTAEDKNFDYYSVGGEYRVDSKPNTKDFKKLGCGYYYFGGRIFHSVYELSGADASTFRVLGSRENPDQDIESCQDFYAIDKDHRYQFELPVRADDTDRNHQIDLLLATPEDRKRISEVKFTYICVPQYRPGVNFGFSQVQNESTNPGTIKCLSFVDAKILEPQLINADGQWQPLPTITQAGGLLSGCDSIGVERFWEGEKKPWFSRRDPTSISLVVNRFGQDPVFVVADSRYSIKLAFSKTSLIQLLRDELSDSRLTPFDNNVAGWGSGWILENKFFVSREHMAEVWVPLRIKNVPVRNKEGQDFVTVGFKYTDGQFECVDTTQCSGWSIPQKFKADLNQASTAAPNNSLNPTPQ